MEEYVGCSEYAILAISSIVSSVTAIPMAFILISTWSDFIPTMQFFWVSWLVFIVFTLFGGFVLARNSRQRFIFSVVNITLAFTPILFLGLL